MCSLGEILAVYLDPDCSSQRTGFLRQDQGSSFVDVQLASLPTCIDVKTFK